MLTREVTRFYDMETGAVIIDLPADDDTLLEKFDPYCGIVPETEQTAIRASAYVVLSRLKEYEFDKEEADDALLADLLCDWWDELKENGLFENLEITENRQIPDADCYAIQRECDGFGNDTYTVTLLPTKAAAVEYAEQNGYDFDNIIPQYWGKEYKNKFN